MAFQSGEEERSFKMGASSPSPSPFEEKESRYVKSIKDEMKSQPNSVSGSRVAFNVEIQEYSIEKTSYGPAKSMASSKSATATVRRTRDIVWQENPDRVLKYRANHLHYYGWIPLLMLRNIKATVFSDVYIHLQTIALISYVAILHSTGLGVADADLKTFVTLFGTPYAGSILNLGMVMVFILGLFISLVINRWSTIRQAYGQLRGTTLDLCMIVSNAINSQHKHEAEQTMKARTELIRLLNLGHLLVVSRADKENGNFQKSHGLKTFSKHAMRSSKKFMSDMGLSRSLVQEVGDRWDQVWRKNPRDVTYMDLLDEGLVNPDEWKLLMEAERDGLPAYQAVYYWVQALIHKCRAADWVISGPQMLPIILNKANSIASSGSTILSSIGSQMPYPYVHLVSFVAHAYLIVLSSWFGCFLRVGYPSGANYTYKDGTSEFSISKPDKGINENAWTVIWIYLLMAVANILFQGLLNMHTLLDNPFGSHCAKFPLRAQVAQVMNATRAMLTCSSDLPEAFDDVFKLQPAGSVDVGEDSFKRLSSKGSSFADFLHPPSRKGSGSIASLNVGGSTFLQQSKDALSPRVSERTARKIGRISSMDTLQEVVDAEELDKPTPCAEADEAMVRPSEPPSAPKTTKCVSRGLSIHNQIVFGNLPEREPSMNQNISGDATLQELFLQVSVADAVQHSFSALRSSMETRGEQSLPQNPQDRSEDSMEEPVQEKEM